MEAYANHLLERIRAVRSASLWWLITLAIVASAATVRADSANPELSLELSLSPAPDAGTPSAQTSDALTTLETDESTNDYRVDSGDRVSITVYQEDDLNVEGARVRDNGTIAFPLLGDMRVRGLTSAQIKSLVTRRLADGYLKNPNVTVSIDAYRLYYIKGEVSRPGVYSYMDGLTVDKAIALAGGYTVRASENDITLVREADPDNPLKVRSSSAIEPGDVITVGESFF